MNEQKKIDIISSILDHPQWEAKYLFELIKELVDLEGNNRFSFKTNTAYILNTYFQHTKKDSIVDGKAFEFIRKEHDNPSIKHGFIKITFEVIE